MHIPTLLAVSLAALPSFVAAHGDGIGGPRIFGRRAIQDLKARNIFATEKRQVHGPAPAPLKKRKVLQERQNTAGQCGAGFGSCAAGYCCSGAGWCGKGTDYCAAPDCQWQYGPGCDANQTPPGTNTSTVTRTRFGSVLYGGGGIYDCATGGKKIALTFDDGPYIYTSDILDVLKTYNAKATFFITGNNLGKGEIDNAYYPWPAVIQRMLAEGHQIASHTWSHQDLDSLTSAQRKNQMYKNEMAIRNIIGKFPTYMRPPYSNCGTSGCMTDMFNLGYHVVYFDLDTDDYDNTTPSTIQNAKNNFANALATNSEDYLAIAHDIHDQTVHNLTAYMLQTLQSKGYTAVTLGDCLGDPSGNWYRNSSGSVFTSAPTTTIPTTSTSTSTGPTVSPTAVSPDGTCGGTTGYTCQGSVFGNCCSVNGWCGTSSAYCGTGCQSSFGTCGTSTGTTTTATTSPTAVSTSGQCGPSVGQTCQGSTFGNCCSQYGWCGSTTGHCGTGCQTGYGTCSVGSSSSISPSSSGSLTSSSVSSSSSSTSTSTKTSSSTSPTATIKVSTDGKCGSAAGSTCVGSKYGSCCSSNNKCGSGFLSCGIGCQKTYSSGCLF